jgi:hypothetical protein
LAPLKDVRCAQLCLEDLASLLSEHGRPSDAARLFGASEALLELIGKPLSRAQREPRDRGVTVLKQRLDPESLGTAWAEGRAMTLEQAITYAQEGPALT